MIKLTDILKEGKVLLQSNDKDADSLSEIADFLVHGKLHNVFQFIPRKSVDLDKIDSLGDINVTEQLVKFAEKKTKIKFLPLYDFKGAGYGIQIDIDFIVKKLK
ncbi:hypothetical protein N9I13_00480 [bacterium]|mgnify:FL=1|jgi:hypothetical protein|nr:hypothetical protein [bacterium]|tara:strand:- start:166 stop:477 length:312 start_codon:yes stop_codon:yes gene_type:complete